MPHQLEITLRAELHDAEGDGIRKKASDYFGIRLRAVRTIYVVTVDAALSKEQQTVGRQFPGPMLSMKSPPT